MTLSAYTGPSPETGYVGYVNFTRKGDQVTITVRPKSADGSGTVELLIPVHAAMVLCSEVVEALRETKRG